MLIFKMLWTLPNTLIGLILGFLSFAWPRWEKSGVLIFESDRGFRKLHSEQGYGAITFGHVVISKPNPSPRLMRHEMAHVKQYERWGPFYMLAYGFYWLKLTLTGKDGYHDNPFEVEASKAEALGAETSGSAVSGSGASETESADLTSASMSS